MKPKTVTATEARRTLPRLLDGVLIGNAFVITRRRRPVALLRGLEADDEPLPK